MCDDDRYTSEVAMVKSSLWSEDCRGSDDANSVNKVYAGVGCIDRCLKELKGHTSWVNSVAFSEDGMQIVSVIIAARNTVSLGKNRMVKYLERMGHCRY